MFGNTSRPFNLRLRCTKVCTKIVDLYDQMNVEEAFRSLIQSSMFLGVEPPNRPSVVFKWEAKIECGRHAKWANRFPCIVAMHTQFT